MRRNREVILDTFFDYLVGQVPEFKTTGRRVLHWTDEAPQPALYMRHTADEDASALDPLSKNTMEAELWVFSQAGADSDTTPDKVLNELVGKIRKALAPDDSDREVFTLGGLVWACGIHGRSEFDPGDRDKFSKAVLPIKFILP